MKINLNPIFDLMLLPLLLTLLMIGIGPAQCFTLPFMSGNAKGQTMGPMEGTPEAAVAKSPLDGYQIFGISKFGPPSTFAEMAANPAKIPYGNTMDQMPFMAKSKIFWIRLNDDDADV